MLSPAKRTESGYRLYGDKDLVRLQHILALKFLGFSLEEIREFLAQSPLGLRDALAQQKAMLRERRSQLDAVLEAIERAEQHLAVDESDWESLANLIRAIQMGQQNEWHKKYFTDEQLRTLNELGEQSYTPEDRAKLKSRGPWTEEDQRRVDEQYAELYVGVRNAVGTGQAPGDAEGQALAATAIGLLEAFTGGDPEIWAGLQEFWKNQAQLPAERQPVQIPLTEAESNFLNEAKGIYMQRRREGGVL